MKILVICKPFSNGVQYHRVFSPHIEMQRVFGSQVHVDFIENLDNLSTVVGYDIVFFHRTAVAFDRMEHFFEICSKNNVKTVCDIDDSWDIPITHPSFYTEMLFDPNRKTTNNIKNCDLVTTTTKNLYTLIKTINKDVEIVENGISFSDTQFSEEKYYRNKPHFGFVTGASHYLDMIKMKDYFEVYNSTNDFQDKYSHVLCGFDLRGERYDNDFITDELVEDLQEYNLYYSEIIEKIKENKGKLDNIKEIPMYLKTKYRFGVKPKMFKRQILPKETTWYSYENIITSNYKKLAKQNSIHVSYYDYLHKFINDSEKGNEFLSKESVNYYRFFTKSVRTYGEHYKNIDVSFAPLADIPFNSFKSELKMIEAGFTKTAIIVSDVDAYKHIAKHEENCLIIKKDRKDWLKNVKKLLRDEQLLKHITNNLNQQMKKDYNLEILVKKRYELYKTLINK